MNPIFKFALTAIFLLGIISCNQKIKKPDVIKKERKTLEMVTDYGTMLIELYDETPLHRDNFINLVTHKAYDSVLFHRIIKDFMIQAGDPDSKLTKANDSIGEGDLPYKVAAEFNTALFHKKGALAAARDNNPERASSGMQFYIVQGKTFNDSTLKKAEERINQFNAKEYFKDDSAQKQLLEAIDHATQTRNLEHYQFYMDSILSLAIIEKGFKSYTIPEDQRLIYKKIGGTPHLDQNYTVFGEVVKGIEVLDSIAKVATGALDRPLNDMRIQKIRLLD